MLRIIAFSVGLALTAAPAFANPKATAGADAGAYAGASASATGGAVIVNGAGTGAGYGHIPPASAIAPNVYQNNACSGSGISAAVQTGIFGFALGTGNRFDDACRLHMLGQDEVAFEYLCRQSDDIRAAAKAAGMPCASDRPVAAALPPAQFAAAPTVPDWCDTLSDPAERETYRYVCALPGRVKLPRH